MYSSYCALRIIKRRDVCARGYSTTVIIIFSFVFKNVFDFSAVTCFAFVFTAVLYKYDTRRWRPGDNTSVVVVVDTAAAEPAMRVRGKRLRLRWRWGRRCLHIVLKFNWVSETEQRLLLRRPCLPGETALGLLRKRRDARPPPPPQHQLYSDETNYKIPHISPHPLHLTTTTGCVLSSFYITHHFCFFISVGSTAYCACSLGSGALR